MHPPVGSQESTIHEVDFRQLAVCPSVALYGKRRAGKTTYGKHIVHAWLQKCSRIIVYAGNEDARAEWRRMVPGLFVMSYNEDHLARVLAYQSSKVAQFTDAGLPIPDQYLLTVVVDDCGSKDQVTKSKVFANVLADGRHHGVNFLGMFQGPLQLSRTNRENFDYVGTLFTPNVKNLKLIYEEYIPNQSVSFKSFLNLVNCLTANRGMCWIDGTKQSHLLTDFLMYRDVPSREETRALQFTGASIRQYAEKHTIKYRQAPLDVAMEEEQNDSDDEDEDVALATPTDIIRDRITINDGKRALILRKVKN